MMRKNRTDKTPAWPSNYRKRGPGRVHRQGGHRFKTPDGRYAIVSIPRLFTAIGADSINAKAIFEQHLRAVDGLPTGLARLTKARTYLTEMKRWGNDRGWMWHALAAREAHYGVKPA